MNHPAPRSGRRPAAGPADAPLTNVRSERIRRVAALGRRSARSQTGLFLAEGPQAVREAVAWRPDVVRDVYVDPAGRERHPEIVESARAAGLHVHDTSPEVLAAMCDTSAPQGLLAVCRRLDSGLDDVLAAGPGLLVVLTNVRDPGNAGTVIRGADAAGADAVLVGDASVDVYNPKVVRSTAGSLFHLPVVVGLDVPDLLHRLRGSGVRTLAADGAASHTLDDVDLSGPHAWVMGNEAWGLPPELRGACDDVVAVPIHGHAESLNLAMAATVCLYESARVRHGRRDGPVGRVAVEPQDAGGPAAAAGR